MLAGESSESAKLELGSGSPKQSGAIKENADSLANPRRKQPNQPDAKVDVLEAK
jgi:hypothetical protein